MYEPDPPAEDEIAADEVPEAEYQVSEACWHLSRDWGEPLPGTVHDPFVSLRHRARTPAWCAATVADLRPWAHRREPEQLRVGRADVEAALRRR